MVDITNQLQCARSILPEMKHNIWKWMLGILVSFWGPAYFPRQTVSFREGSQNPLKKSDEIFTGFRPRPLSTWWSKCLHHWNHDSAWWLVVERPWSSWNPRKTWKNKSKTWEICHVVLRKYVDTYRYFQGWTLPGMLVLNILLWKEES